MGRGKHQNEKEKGNSSALFLVRALSKSVGEAIKKSKGFFQSCLNKPIEHRTKKGPKGANEVTSANTRRVTGVVLKRATSSNALSQMFNLFDFASRVLSLLSDSSKFTKHAARVATYNQPQTSTYSVGM